MALNDESFRRLRGELILATIVGTFQKKELVFQDKLELTPFHGHLIVQQEGVPNVKTARFQAAVPGAISSANG